MKKTSIIFILLLSIFSYTNADFGSPSSLNLYKNIDKGFENIQDRMENFEIEGGQQQKGILTEINKYAILNEKPACLDDNKSISVSNFKNIVKTGDISGETGIMKYLVPNCINSIIKEEGKDKINKEYNEKLKELSSAKWDNNITASDCGNIEVKRYKKVGDKYVAFYRPQNDAECKNQKYKEERNKLLKKRDNKINNYGSEGTKERKDFLSGIVTTYLELFNSYELEKKELASIKSTQLYKISKIGLYADGDIDNSGFDLINDIEEIDKIIFADVLNYTGEPNKDLDESLNNFLKPLVDKVNELSSPNFGKKIDGEKTGNPIIQTPLIKKTENNKNKITTTNNYLCSGALNNSGLSPDAINGLLNNINKDLNSNGTLKSNGELDKNNLNGGTKVSDPNSSINNPNGAYEKVRDNSQWPCEDFFCINIDFTTYEHSLFGGGENITIEYLLNRSNKHLSKHAATSLVPAKMGTNEFELGLKDLNLPDVFHMSVQISTKPIPILNIEKKSKKDESEYSAENMMKSYYELNGLNYNRRNDLILLNQSETDKQNTNNSPGLTPEALLKKQIENDAIIAERHKKIATIENAIYSKTSYGVLGTFDEQFTELNKFTTGINEYVNNLYSLIKKLREIPIEY